MIEIKTIHSVVAGEEERVCVDGSCVGHIFVEDPVRGSIDIVYYQPDGEPDIRGRAHYTPESLGDHLKEVLGLEPDDDLIEVLREALTGNESVPSILEDEENMYLVTDLIDRVMSQN